MPPSIVARSSPAPKRRARATTGAKRRQGSIVQVAVATLGHLLALRVTSANEQDRTQVANLAAQVQAATGHSVEVAFVDQSYPAEHPEAAATQQGIRLEVVKLPAARKGLVLLPRRWVVERCFAWTARFRRLARHDERLPHTLTGLHFLPLPSSCCPRFIHLLAHCL